VVRSQLQAPHLLAKASVRLPQRVILVYLATADLSRVCHSDVIDSCTVKAADDAKSDLTHQVYLGRPWTQYAQAVFKNCSLSDIINPAGEQQHSSFYTVTDTCIFQDGRNGAPPNQTRKSND
jgi:hypothetical protein